MAEHSVHYTPPIGAQGQAARAPIVTPLEEMRLNKYRAKWAELLENGWKTATVINLAPWQLYCSGVLAPVRELRIGNVPRDQEMWNNARKLQLASGAEIPFVKHVFELPEVTILEQVIGFEGSYTGSTDVQVTQPIQFARDVEQQNNTPVRRGGIFFYYGSHDPLTNKDTVDKERALLEQAHAELILYCNRLLDEGNSAHAENNKEKLREIQKYHRWGVRYLRLLGLLPEDPKWVHQVVKVGKPITQHCDQCGAEVSSDAVICIKCNRVLKPFEAFTHYVIDLESPGARLALKRMSSEEIAQLVEMDLFSFEDLQALNVEVKKAERKSKAAKDAKTAKDAETKG